MGHGVYWAYGYVSRRKGLKPPRVRRPSDRRMSVPSTTVRAVHKVRAATAGNSGSVSGKLLHESLLKFRHSVFFLAGEFFQEGSADIKTGEAA